MQLWGVLDRVRETQINHGEILRALEDRQEHMVSLLEEMKKVPSTPKGTLLRLLMPHLSAGGRWMVAVLAAAFVAHGGDVGVALGVLAKLFG